MVHVANQFIDPLLGELVVGDAIELTNCFLGVVARGDLALSVSGVAESDQLLAPFSRSRSPAMVRRRRAL